MLLVSAVCSLLCPSAPVAAQVLPIAPPAPGQEAQAGRLGPAPRFLFVDGAATGADDGSSWSDAHRDLALALDRARGGTRILVAGGTYLPDRGTGNPSLRFDIPNDVELLGGYAGVSGARPFANDPTLFPTVLSGDLLGDDGPGFTNRADNSIGLAWVGGAGRVGAGRVRGVTFRGSEGSSAVFVFGPARFEECFFEDSRAVFRGGGLYAVADLWLRDCAFRFNRVDVATNFGSNTAGGGGLALGSFSGGVRAELLRCTFDGNRVEVADPASFEKSGGGLLFASSLPSFDQLRLRDCSFVGNALVGRGMSRGGGLRSEATTDLVRCDFIANRIENASGQTSLGAGLCSGDESFGSASNVTRSVSCRLLGNRIEADLGAAAVSIIELAGAGAWIAGGEQQNLLAVGNVIDLDNPGGCLGRTVVGGALAGPRPVLRQATLAHNSLSAVGGVGLFGQTLGGALAISGAGAVDNSILWANDTNGAQAETDQLRLYDGGSVSLGYSSLQGWSGALGGLGNVGNAPAFVDPDGADGVFGTADDDLRLQLTSPLCDAGDSAAVGSDILDVDADGDLTEELPWDAAGNPRRLENAMVPNTGSGPAPPVDLGALEVSG